MCGDLISIWVFTNEDASLAVSKAVKASGGRFDALDFRVQLFGHRIGDVKF
jgi:hypothetical protein